MVFDQERAGHIAGGVKLAAPIILGYIPVGFAYGVLAGKMGISPANTLLMSLIVFAGSSQFIAVGLFASGASFLSVVLTTFVVNLRHLLMSAALSPHVKSWKKRELTAFGFQLTDETFAVHSTRFMNRDPVKAETFAVNMTAQLSWVMGSLLGIGAGAMIESVEPIGLDYALPAMFIALLVGQIKGKVHLVVAVLAGFLSVGFHLSGMEQFHVILATVVAATMGVFLRVWTRE